MFQLYDKNQNMRYSALGTLGCLLVLAMSLAACSGGSSETASNEQLSLTGPDRSSALFDPAHVVQVDIQMDSTEYDTLRYEGRGMGDVLSGCFVDFEYDHYSATVTVDGERFENVDIRKKGFLGSLSPSRPSLKLNFGTHVQGRTVQSMRRLTLNNNRQDGSATHQCVSYDLFRQAGLVAPRCNFARVSVNGADLGYYSNVESMKAPFVSRNFEQAGGNLYEGQIAAFTELRLDGFQLKTNEHINDRSDLDAVVNALAADDANFPTLIEQVINIDQFIDFWAMEIITGHWDGATGNANNHYIYNDPADGRFQYIPWGTDGALSPRGLGGSNFPLSHYSLLSDRLYNTPQYKGRLFERINALLDTVFDEQAIESEMDRIAALTDADAEAVQGTKDWINAHRANLEQAMSGGIADTAGTLVAIPSSDLCSTIGRAMISGSFNGNVSNFTISLPDGTELNAVGGVTRDSLGGVAAPGSTNPPGEPINLIAGVPGGAAVVVMQLEQPEFTAGKRPLHGVANTLFLVDTRPGGSFWIASKGSITLSNISADGATVTGEFEAEVVRNNSFLGGG